MPNKNELAKVEPDELAIPQPNALAAFGGEAVDVSMLIGREGNENVTSDDKVIPMFKTLQAMSPECQGKKAIHKAGTFFLSGHDLSFDPDEVDVYFVPVLFAINYIELSPKGEDLAILARHTKIALDDMLRNKVIYFDEKEYGWKYYDPEYKNVIKVSHAHVGVVLLPDGSALNCVMYLKSTSLRASKELNTKVDGRMINGEPCKRYANVFKLSIKDKSNDFGTWYTPSFNSVLDADGRLVTPPLAIYKMAERLYQELSSGAVVAAQEEGRVDFATGEVIDIHPDAVM